MFRTATQWLAVAVMAGVVGLATWSGGGGPRLISAVHELKPGVTCPQAPPNGAFKIEKRVVGAETYTIYTGGGFTAGDVTAINAAFTTWMTGTDLSNTLFTSATDAGNGTVALDGFNAIIFAPLGGNTIARTNYWFSPATKQTIEFDITFNSNLSWGVLNAALDANTDGCLDSVEDPTGYNKFDVEDIMAHEIIHVIGVAHTSPNGANNAQTAYPFGQEGEIYKRTLGNGDVAGANAKY